jgi:tetratricopeptide (TPR) repeat protein
MRRETDLRHANADINMGGALRVSDDHLTLEMLANWLSGQLDPEDLHRCVLPHFLANCATCRTRYEQILDLQRELGHWDERVAVFEGLDVPRLLAALQKLPFERQIQTVTEDSEFQTWALCQALIKKSQEAVFDQPAQAVGMAELAVSIALQLGDAYDVHWVSDLRARAHAYLGNSRRVLGELRSAEAAFRSAEEFLQKSMTGNEYIRAEVLHLKSSLLRQQRRLEGALQLAEESLAIYRDLGDHHGISVVLVKKAKIIEERGDVELAIDLLREATTEIDAVQDVRIRAYARHNLLVCLAAVGRYAEAQEYLKEVKPIFQQVARPLDLVRLRLAEGRIDSGLRKDTPAEKAFREVREEFLSRDMAYDAALVSLDLALLLTRQHRMDEVKALANEMVAFFEMQDVRREVFASLCLFKRACEEERLTVDLIKQISRLIESELRRKSRQ